MYRFLQDFNKVVDYYYDFIIVFNLLVSLIFCSQFFVQFAKYRTFNNHETTNIGNKRTTEGQLGRKPCVLEMCSGSLQHLRLQLYPSPSNPSLQEQLYDPKVLIHSAS